jgi:hypothetical protein
MPTGYTDKIYNKKEVDFRSYALRCARAFGANILMRDDSIEAEIKDYEVSNYHIEKLNDNLEELEDILKWDQERIDEYNRKIYIKKIEDYNESLLDRLELKHRYEMVLIEVYDWVPPTKDHIGLKQFMIEQLKGSIEFDCEYKIDKPIMEDYYNKKIKDLNWKISYHRDEHDKVTERVRQRNEWNRALKASL